jgi:hypothetical protein
MKIFRIGWVSDPAQRPQYYPESHSNISYCRGLPSTYTVTDVPPEEWEKREYCRFEYDIYKRPPSWFPRTNPDHYVHVSTENPLFLAYTPDEAKGRADRQVRIKPGKYLQKFHPDVDVAALAARWAAEFGPLELKIACSADEIEEVYVNGPGSCMSYRQFQGVPMHPARVYADGDLRVAYIYREGRVTARTLIWPERKIYGRVYGDYERLTPLLHDAGYSPTSEGDYAFEGARLGRHPHGNGFILPYVDWHHWVEDDGTHLVISRRRTSINTQTASGTTNTWWFCPYYDEWTDPDDRREVFNDNTGDYEIWSGPRVQAEAFQCASSGRYFARTSHNAIELSDGQLVHLNYIHHIWTCAGSGRQFIHAPGTHLPNGDWVSNEYLNTLHEWFQATYLEADLELRLAA